MSDNQKTPPETPPESLRDRADQLCKRGKYAETDTFLSHVVKRMGMNRPDDTDARVAQMEFDRQQRQAQDNRLLTRFLPNNDDRVITAAKDAIEHWLAGLHHARLIQPFFIDEIKLAAAHVLAARGFKNTMLPPVVLSKALWQLGFIKGRMHGTTRPQTRYWLHPAAQAAKPATRTRKSNT